MERQKALRQKLVQPGAVHDQETQDLLGQYVDLSDPGGELLADDLKDTLDLVVDTLAAEQARLEADEEDPDQAGA